MFPTQPMFADITFSLSTPIRIAHPRRLSRSYIFPGAASALNILEYLLILNYLSECFVASTLLHAPKEKF